MFLTQKAALFAVVVLAVSFVNAVSLASRSSAACVYLKPKIYCYGGRLYHRDASGQLAIASTLFNSLDISNSSDLGPLQQQWEPIPHVDPTENFDSATVAVPDYNAIFMDGGAGKDDNYGFVAKYNTTIYSINEGKWSTDTPTGHLDTQSHCANLGPNNTIYVWGGGSYPDYQRLQDPVEYPIDMYLFHFQTLSWTTGPAVSAIQLNRVMAKSALGKDDSSIYYIGGAYPATPKYENKTRYILDGAPMNQILIFDIKNQQWKTENTTGPTPSTRAYHTLTSKPDTGDLILLGGMEPINSTDYREDYLYLLNTDKMEWTAKEISSQPGATYTATIISEHSAILAGSELFVMFGQVPYTATSDVRVIDTESWSWKTSIVGVQNPPPAVPTADVEPSDSSSGSNAGTIAGAVVGSIAGVAIIAALVFFFLRRRRHTRKEVAGGQGIRKESQEYSVPDPTSPTGFSINDESTTQISSNVDAYHGNASSFYGTEKPDGAQRLVMKPVKPDGV